MNFWLFEVLRSQFLSPRSPALYILPCNLCNVDHPSNSHSNRMSVSRSPSKKRNRCFFQVVGEPLNSTQLKAIISSAILLGKKEETVFCSYDSKLAPGWAIEQHWTWLSTILWSLSGFWWWENTAELKIWQWIAAPHDDHGLATTCSLQVHKL